MESRPATHAARALAALGYSVKLVDEKSGIVNTEWYEYGVPFGNNYVPMPVRERVQVLVGRTALDVRFEAHCDWRKSAAGGNAQSLWLRDRDAPDTLPAASWEPCMESSVIPNAEVKERYAAVIAALRVLPREPAGAPTPAVAQTGSAPECRTCPEQCRTHREGCNAGDVGACRATGACLCRCKLAAGGCGEAFESLERCAKDLGAPAPSP